MPKLMQVVEKQIKEQFADDKGAQLTLLKSIKELKPLISKLLIALPYSLQSEKDIWSLVFNKLLPILDHKEAHQIARIFGKENFQQAAVKFIKALEPYQEYPLHELMSLKTFLPLFQRACQLELVQQLIKNLGYKDILNRFSGLEPQLLESFYHLDYASLFSLIQVLAHPNFYNLLQALPEQANFGHLKIWLNTEPDNAPLAIRPALKQLRDHQQNRERIAEENRLKLLALKERFTLSPEKLAEGLQRLVPVFTAEALAEEPRHEPEVEFIPVESDALSVPKKASKMPFWLKACLVVCAVVLCILFSWIIIPVAMVGAAIYASISLFKKKSNPKPALTEVIEIDDLIHEKASAEMANPGIKKPYLEPLVISMPEPLDNSLDLTIDITEEEILPAPIYTSVSSFSPTLFKPANNSRLSVDKECSLRSSSPG